jgi:hypothetical protein
MEARQRLGFALLATGVVVMLIGVAGTVGFAGSPSAAIGSPTPAPSAGIPTEPGMSVGPPSAAPTTATTPAPTSAPTQDTLGIVRAFFVELETAVHTGSQETMADRLGGAVIERYGLEACTQDLARKEPFPEQAFEILAVLPPAPWDYVTDGLSTTVADATTVQARVTGPDAGGTITTEARDLHVQLVDGVVHWFTDCGTPLAG